MLVIRKEQMAVLLESHFENWMIGHLNRFFSNKVQGLDREGLREMIREGEKRAEMHGFTAQDHIKTFIDLMFVLGNRFDEDPKLPWATQILQDKDVDSAGERMDMLYETALDWLEAHSDQLG